jgi:hypothetical protein
LKTRVIGLSQEDTELASAAKFVKGLPAERPFEVVFDFNRERTAAYDRTTAYLIDGRGVVRQVFPMLIHARPSWEAILGELRRVTREDASK